MKAAKSYKKVINSRNKCSYIADSIYNERSKPIKDRDYDKIAELRNEYWAASNEYEERFKIHQAAINRYKECLRPSSRFIEWLKNFISKLRKAV